MAKIFDKQYSKQELKSYVGDISQIADAKYSELKDGRGGGVSVVDIKTGGGLDISVLPGRGMDFAGAQYKGVPFGYISNTGVVSPTYFDENGMNYFRNFTAGLLTTCGLCNVGPPCEDDGKLLGIHGKISNIPADDIGISKEWVGDEFVFKVRGKVRESEFFAQNLTLTREISFSLGDKKILISDAVENCGFKPHPLMLLYHFNFGHPLVGTDTKLYHTSAHINPKDDYSAKYLDNCHSFEVPVLDCPENVFFYDMKPSGDNVFSCLYNDVLGFGVYLKYKKSQLSNFTQWKNMGKGAYVTAMEPCNTPPIGRAAAREQGILEFLEEGEVRRFDIELGIVDGRNELAELQNYK
ncbi:MAG: aldose 1-epimerase family protein [Clostridia bacterium]|jgi:hypothetical protein|nr:aldose 1-epimerase family protein [Clostridia bacterium]MBT7121574.1 aldose 1-epimerase family protein [Clostridia bacterium]